MFPSQLPKARSLDPRSVPSLRWGIIGPGWIAERFVRSLKEFTSQQLVAVASRSQERADIFASKMGIPQAFGSAAELLASPDIDAVYIATPHNHHYPDGLQALNAGKHVLIEKPLALNAQQARGLSELAKAKGLLCMEAMWCDFLPKYDIISQLLEDGVLGDLYTLIADHGEFFTPEHRIFNADLAGGPMMDLGSYLVGFSVKIAGTPAAVYATGQQVPGGVNGQTSMLLTHNNGMHSVLNTTLFTNTPCAAVIAGRDATLEIGGNSFYAPGPFTLTSSQGGKVLHFDEPRNRYDQLFHEAVHFAWCVGQGKTDSPVRPLSASIDTLTTMDEVRRQTGQVFNEER